MPVAMEEMLPLATASFGTTRSLTVRRYGKPGARPKVYLQASLHADELPGALVLDHLENMLEAATAITGEIIVVPLANPIGLDQFVDGYHLGRQNLDRGGNFNRGHPDPASDVLKALEGKLGAEVAANAALVRAELIRLAKERLEQPAEETDHLRHQLHALSCDADIVLDCHCDNDANLHLYCGKDNWPDASDLCAYLGIETILLARESGDMPFDESHSLTWVKLKEALGEDFPLPVPLSTTIEFRGEVGLSDEVSRKDAEGLYHFLVRRGVVAGKEEAVPDLKTEAFPLEGVEMIRTPVPGILVHQVPAGCWVEPDTLLAEILNPLTRERREIRSSVAGCVYGRLLKPLVRPNDIVVKVAGKEPLAGKTGNLLTD